MTASKKEIDFICKAFDVTPEYIYASRTHDFYSITRQILETQEIAAINTIKLWINRQMNCETFHMDDIIDHNITGQLTSFLSKISSSDPINITINSPGGNIFDAIAIFNTLKDRPGLVNVQIFGCCGGAALLVAAAADSLFAVRDSILTFSGMGIVTEITAFNTEEVSNAQNMVLKTTETTAELLAMWTGLNADQITGYFKANKTITGAEANDRGWLKIIEIE